MIFGKDAALESGTEEISTESQALIMEAAMLDVLTADELHAFCENHTEVQAALRDQVLLEKTIVRLDKKAKMSRAKKMAIFEIAKARKDVKFKKLITIWRIERALENFLDKKYGAQAERMARQAVSNAQRTKSNIVKSVAAKVHGELNSSIPVRGSHK